MGMFSSIMADLPCSTMGEEARGEIQIKWQCRDNREGAAYYLGDTLDRILPEYDNTWIRTDFVCEACSQRTTGKSGQSYIKVMEQQRHIVFVRVDEGKIGEIVSEDDFKKRGIDTFATDIL